MKTLLLALIASLALAASVQAQPLFWTSLQTIDGRVAPNVGIIEIQFDGLMFCTTDGRAWFLPAGMLCYGDRLRFGYVNPNEGFTVDERRRMAAIGRAISDPDPARRAKALEILRVAGY
jgi:hypothetical protein